MRERLENKESANPYLAFEQCLGEADSIQIQYGKNGEILSPNGHPSTFNKFRLKNNDGTFSQLKDDPVIMLAKIVRTPTFINGNPKIGWEGFGNWMKAGIFSGRGVSKFVDKVTHEPCIGLHGTSEPFSAKLKTSAASGYVPDRVLYFTSIPKVAWVFAKKSMYESVNGVHNWSKVVSGEHEAAPNMGDPVEHVEYHRTQALKLQKEWAGIHAAFLSLKKPKYVRSHDQLLRIFTRSALLPFTKLHNFYDGVIQLRGNISHDKIPEKTDQEVVFKSEQVFQIPFTLMELKPPNLNEQLFDSPVGER